MTLAASTAAKTNGSARERRCIVTGEVLPEAQLIRFVADGENRIVPDLAAKLPGRGLWVKADHATIAKAVAKNLFARAAEAQVKADADLPNRCEKLLLASLRNSLGLARKSGELILGFEKLDQALRSPNPPAVLVEASDGAEDGQRKLVGAALAGGHAPFVIGCFSAHELDLALGLNNVIHAGLRAGRSAERLVLDARRLEGFRPVKPLAWNGFSGRNHLNRAGQTPQREG